MRRILRSRALGLRTNILGTLPNMRLKLQMEDLLIRRRCACDVPSHNYTWSFEPKLDWSGVYASSSEIFNYFDSFAKKYKLGQYVKTNHAVTGAFWNHEKGGYNVTIRDTLHNKEVVDHCDILINASGILNNW